MSFDILKQMAFNLLNKAAILGKIIIAKCDYCLVEGYVFKHDDTSYKLLCGICKYQLEQEKR